MTGQWTRTASNGAELWTTPSSELRTTCRSDPSIAFSFLFTLACVRFVYSQLARMQSEGLIGKVESEFDYNRAKLLDTMGAGVRNVVASYDKTEEARQLANEVPYLPTSVQSRLCGPVLFLSVATD